MMKTKSKLKTPAKGAKSPGKGKVKSAKLTKRPAAKTAKKAQKSALAKQPSGKKIFEGATEISLTENKIAVTRSASHGKPGLYTNAMTRQYYDRTAENMRALGDIMNDRSVKKITVKLK